MNLTSLPMKMSCNRSLRMKSDRQTPYNKNNFTMLLLRNVEASSGTWVTWQRVQVTHVTRDTGHTNVSASSKLGASFSGCHNTLGGCRPIMYKVLRRHKWIKLFCTARIQGDIKKRHWPSHISFCFKWLTWLETTLILTLAVDLM